MKNKISCLISIIVTISLLSTTIPSLLQPTTANNNSVQILECTSNPYFNEWHYYKLITINHEKVEADLNNFPVLLSIQDIDLRDKAQPDGDDIAFSNQNGTPLNHEIESYNSTTGNLTAWINITSISSSTNTTLYMYYGNPNCENQQNVLDVWNSDYIMVQHLEEDAGTTVFDSTSNNNDGISTGTTFNEECKINGGREYEGDDYITVNDFTTVSTGLTAEAWVYRDDTTYINLFCEGTDHNDCDWNLYLRTSFSQDGVNFGINNNTNRITAGQTPENTWVYITATYDNGDVVIYIDGVEIGSGTIWSGQINNNHISLGLGNDNDGGQPWNGMLDELRISEIARNNSWVKTSFNTMNNTEEFLSLGPEVIIPHEPVVFNPSPADGAVNVSITLNELSFNITDPQGDLMDYTVETKPDIGSDSAEGVGNGRYNITVDGLEYDTEYIWYVNVTGSSGSNSWTNESFTFTTISQQNNPPYEPSNPNPEDGANDVSIDATLSWTGGDPDDDPVTYDIYFGITSPPEKIESNQTETAYDPELEYSQTYYWKIVAWDDSGESTEGDIWEFSTIEQQQLSVEITQPEENYFYIRNMKLLQLNNKTFIYGPITIIANVTSNTDIEKVEFYVDGNKKHTDEETPYEYNWSPIISFKRTIKVIAYDGEGNIASDEVEVFKWRLHPLLLMAGAAAVLNPNTKLLHSLSGYTIVRGFVFNIKHTGKTVTFRAIRLHYTKVKLLSTESGVIHLKKCMITSGPDTQIAMGPFGSVSWIFCVYKGTSLENPTFLQTIECGHG
jgi:hypothetical protein